MRSRAPTPDRVALGRALLLLPLAWWAVALATGLATWCWLDLVNLTFHEAGHVVFYPLGSTMAYLGGTLGQLLVPALLVVYFVARAPQPFAAAVCTWWIGESLLNVAAYMADALARALPLIGGDDHDWAELFGRFGMLGEDAVRQVAAGTHGVGVAIMFVALVWGVYFVLPGRWRRAIDAGLTSRWPWTVRLLRA